MSTQYIESYTINKIIIGKLRIMVYNLWREQYSYCKGIGDD